MAGDQQMLLCAGSKIIDEFGRDKSEISRPVL